MPMDPPDHKGTDSLQSTPPSDSSSSDMAYERERCNSRIQRTLRGQFLQACKRDSWDTVDRLLRKRTNPNDRDADFQTTIEYALAAGRIDLARSMIYRGYDLNTLGFHGCLIDGILACWRSYNPDEIIRFIHDILRRHIFLTTYADDVYPTSLIRAARLLREEIDEFRIGCLKIIIRELVMFGSPILQFFDGVDEDLVSLEVSALKAAFKSKSLCLHEIFNEIASVKQVLPSAKISDIAAALKLAIGQRREYFIILLLRELLKRGEYLLVSSNAFSHVLELRLTLTQRHFRRQCILEKLHDRMNSAYAFQEALAKENPSIFRDEDPNEFCEQLEYYSELDESYERIARILDFVVHKAYIMPFISARLMGGEFFNSETRGAFFSVTERRLQAIRFITELLQTHDVTKRQCEQLTALQCVLRRIDVSCRNPFNEIMRIIYLLSQRSTDPKEKQWYLDIIRILWGRFFNCMRQDQGLPRDLVFNILHRIMELDNDNV